MCGLVFPTDENVLVGLDRADDAGVYKVSEDLALIQTVDFFTPVVDDPYWFGQIAAANALSDVYAMGGIPKTAMNLVAFPVKQMDLSVLRRIIQGGLDKLTEAGVVLVGGHSIEDRELKYGLSVTGFIHPRKVLTKKGLRPGDRLVLTKPLGTGIVNTAIKAGLASEALTDRVTRLMAALNREAAAVMAGFDVHACTDVTGFGLLGHLAEMVSGSGAGARLDSGRVPVIAEALEFAAMGLIPKRGRAAGVHGAGRPGGQVHRKAGPGHPARGRPRRKHRGGPRGAEAEGGPADRPEAAHRRRRRQDRLPASQGDQRRPGGVVRTLREAP